MSQRASGASGASDANGPFGPFGLVAQWPSDASDGSGLVSQWPSDGLVVLVMLVARLAQ